MGRLRFIFKLNMSPQSNAHIFYMCMLSTWAQFFWSLLVEKRQRDKCSKGTDLMIQGVPQFELWLMLAEKKAQVRMNKSYFQQICNQVTLSLLLFKIKSFWEFSERILLWFGMKKSSILCN